MNLLDDEELAGVISHEVAHVDDYPMPLGTRIR